MNRAGTPTVAELMALLAANAAEIAVLKAEREALAQRVFKLEEELALAQLRRFAPRSEKHMDRVFNEAEKSAVEGDDEGCDETDCVDLPNTGLPETEKAEGKKRGRRPLPANLPRERVEYDLADDQKICPCCSNQMHRMAHARRRFVDALKARKKPGGPPAQALKYFDQLYRIERQARDEKPDDGETQADYMRRFRQKHSVPVLNALKAWLDAIAPKLVPDTKLEDAVSYARGQWEYLTRYTEDG